MQKVRERIFFSLIVNEILAIKLNHYIQMAKKIFFFLNDTRKSVMTKKKKKERKLVSLEKDGKPEEVVSKCNLCTGREITGRREEMNHRQDGLPESKQKTGFKKINKDMLTPWWNQKYNKKKSSRLKFKVSTFISFSFFLRI